MRLGREYVVQHGGDRREVEHGANVPGDAGEAPVPLVPVVKQLERVAAHLQSNAGAYGAQEVVKVIDADAKVAKRRHDGGGDGVFEPTRRVQTAGHADDPIAHEAPKSRGSQLRDVHHVKAGCDPLHRHTWRQELAAEHHSRQRAEEAALGRILKLHEACDNLDAGLAAADQGQAQRPVEHVHRCGEDVKRDEPVSFRGVVMNF